MLSGLMGQLWPDYYTSPTGGGIDWGQLASQGISVTGAILTNNPYYGPEDPRYRYPAPSTQQQPQRGTYNPGTPSPYSPQPYPQGDGLKISTNTLMLIVGGVLLFMLGQRRR